MISEPKKKVGVLMPMDLYERLDKLAKETHRTIPAYIRQILKRYLQYLDSHSDEQETSFPPI